MLGELTAGAAARTTEVYKRQAQLLGFDSTLVGCTNDYAQTANSDVVAVSYTHLDVYQRQP